MRLIIVFVLAASFLGASDAEARIDASPVAAYKARANSHCRSVTSVALGHIQAMKSAIAVGDQKAAGARYVALINDGAAGTRALIALPVPAATRLEMIPIWQLLGNALRAIDQGLKATTSAAFVSAMKKANAYGLRADPLLDAAGLADCGTKQTRIIRQAAAKLGSWPGPVARPHAAILGTCGTSLRAPDASFLYALLVTSSRLTGGCLCGGVRFEIGEPPVSATYCHCTRCQRRTGTAAAASARLPAGALRIVAGHDLVHSYQPPDGFAKDFCGKCGGALWSRDPEDPEVKSVRLGSLDGDPGIRPSARQYTAYAAAWEPIPDDGLPRFTERRPR